MVIRESKSMFGYGTKHTHSAFESMKLFLRYVLFRNKKYKEDLNYRTTWTCSSMVAHVFKKTGVRIGKRASYMFVPSTFLFSRHFRVKSKVVIR